MWRVERLEAPHVDDDGDEWPIAVYRDGVVYSYAETVAEAHFIIGCAQYNDERAYFDAVGDGKARAVQARQESEEVYADERHNDRTR